jgi:hypothetical protein
MLTYNIRDHLWGLYGFLVGGDQFVAKPLPIQNNTNIEETQLSMPRVEFELMFPELARAKTIHALDSTVTLIGT